MTDAWTLDWHSKVMQFNTDPLVLGLQACWQEVVREKYQSSICSSAPILAFIDGSRVRWVKNHFCIMVFLEVLGKYMK